MSAELKALDFKSVAISGGVTANTNGSGFDLRPYDGDVRLVLNARPVSGTNPTLDVKIQESDDGSTWTDSGVSFTQVTNATGAVFLTKEVTAEQFKRYIRSVDTVGGTSPSFGRSVNLIAKRRV